jgi:6-phosphogluconolactonase
MMSNERRVIVHPDKETLAASVAARFITKVVDLIDEFDEANVVLTGGTMGIAVLAAVNASPARDSVDWSLG